MPERLGSEPHNNEEISESPLGKFRKVQEKNKLREAFAAIGEVGRVSAKLDESLKHLDALLASLDAQTVETGKKFQNEMEQILVNLSEGQDVSENTEKLEKLADSISSVTRWQREKDRKREELKREQEIEQKRKAIEEGAEREETDSEAFQRRTGHW